MKLATAIMALLFAAPVFAQTPTATPTPAFDFPNSPTLNQQVTGPSGQVLKWDGSKWVAQFGSGIGAFAPLVNPTNGQNNYLPISGPTYTGVMTGPTLSVTGTSTLAGTVTFPSGSTATTAGFNNVKALGIGAAAPTTAGNLLQATYNGNGNAAFNISNTSTGANATSIIYLSNNVDAGWILQAGTGFTAGGAAGPADAMQVASNGANGISIATSTAITPAPPIAFWNGGYKTASYTMINGAGTLVLPNGSTSSLYFGGTPTAPFSTITALNAANMSLNAGAHYNGSAWVADNTSIASVALNGYIVYFYSGNATSTVGGGAVNTAVADFQDAKPQVSGLVLGGYAGSINNNNGTPALMLGNGYYGGETWAELDQSGAVYFNAASGQWIADGGAGSGVNLYQQNQGTYTWWNAGGYAGGSAVAWNIGMQLDSGSTLRAVHIGNQGGYGVPNCSNCTSITNYSRDTDGYIQVSGTWPIVLNFARNFTGSVICTGNSLAAPPNAGIISFANNSLNQIYIYCTLAGGAACSSQTGWISYHCFSGT